MDGFGFDDGSDITVRDCERGKVRDTGLAVSVKGVAGGSGGNSRSYDVSDEVEDEGDQSPADLSRTVSANIEAFVCINRSQHLCACLK